MNLRSRKIQERKNERNENVEEALHRAQSPLKVAPQVSFDDIYADTGNAASYSSNVKAFMAQKRSISLHKRKIRNFPRRPIIVPGPYHSICADLIDYQRFSRQNHGYKYILCIVDMFSRMNYVRPLHSKRASEVAEQIDDIINSMQFIPRFFTSDKGLEFDIRNADIRSILEDKYHMIVYYTSGPKKNSMVERFNRTLKERIQRYFTEKNTKKWIDILEAFSMNINNSINRSIGMPPVAVTLENSDMIWKKLYPNKGKQVRCDRIIVGDRVRTVLPAKVFGKGYRQAWSDEIYTVHAIEKSMGFCLYILKSDVVLPRKYYLAELNFVSRNESA